ncbi:FISUMP domain-containing protein [Aureispira sp. CCB-E]|uniref:FISUMP domain-containing protein n=1 Tax=Aureispira sp. CCB-E TaxID=3051121 RepID=UPI00286920D3|nr:FISUMP domain-containing protein [Aureispira sp. CCB-E]WMX14021.1 FISUMP domain-containing protein [Aureispira sp. CCB-E]
MKHILWGCLFVGLIVLGTACKKEVSKMCTNSFVDERDGTEYCMVTIGNQVWMADNLNYASDSNTYTNPSSPSSVNAVYGRLYTFSEANKACPNGWHLPTDEEWKTLEMNLGMSVAEANGLNERGVDQGGQLKSIDGWVASANAGVVGTNSSGFNALPSGEWNPSFGPFFHLGEEASYWTATPYDTTNTAWMRALSYDKASIRRSYATQKMGFACRCVQD